MNHLRSLREGIATSSPSTNHIDEYAVRSTHLRATHMREGTGCTGGNAPAAKFNR